MASAIVTIARRTYRIPPARTATSTHALRESVRSSSPPSVLSIPSTVRYGPTSLRTPLTPPDFPTAGAAVRQVGTARRVFLLRPYLTSDELSGLAYRVRTMGKNDGISSVLIGTSDDDDSAELAFPTSVLDSEGGGGGNTELTYFDYGPRTGFGQVFHVSGGYDARRVYEQGTHEKPGELGVLLDGVRSLALATWGGGGGEEGDDDGGKGGGGGSSSGSRVPVITQPHGLVSDAGYALCLSSYVLATRDTCFRTLNPYRGLTFDPAGLSYVLPRLGLEYNQPAADHPVGAVLALTSFEADASDMVETGLATHYVEVPSKLGTIERSLAEIKPWRQQGLLRQRPQPYGYRTPGTIVRDVGCAALGGASGDDSASTRNVAVANLIQSVSAYDAAGSDDVVCGPDPESERDYFRDAGDGVCDDPTLHLGGTAESYHADRSSTLVDVAATFDDIFRKETVEEIVEGLREVVAAGSSGDGKDEGGGGGGDMPDDEGDEEEEPTAADVASTLLRDMERQSPLALKATHRLLRLGSGRNETVESCMEREKVVQMNLFRGEDFKRWAASGLDEGTFGDWKHGCVEDVTGDEVEELFQRA